MKQIKALATSQTRLLKQLDVSLTLEAVAETTGESDPRTLEGDRNRTDSLRATAPSSVHSNLQGTAAHKGTQ